jgi:hypothetical protein
MAAVTYTAAQVSPVYPAQSEIYDYIAAAAITQGQPVYITTAGKVNLADANAASPANRFRGIALNNASAGQAVSVLVKGAVYGFTLSGLAYDAAVYISDTVGTYDDTASGTTSLAVGKVMPLADKDITKVLYVTGIAG